MMSGTKAAQSHPAPISNPRRGISAVLFDMDGVLVDSVPLHIQAWNTCLSENGLPPLERKTYMELAGKTNRDILTEYLVLNKAVLASAAKQDLIDRKEDLLRTVIRSEARTTPGVMDWLEYLRIKHILCGIASSGEMANIVVVLDALHISNYFASILSGSLLAASKPDPMIFILAAASLGVAPDRCMVIEDAPAGIRAAKAAGMACCALATTFPLDELREADILFENLAQASPDFLFTA